MNRLTDRLQMIADQIEKGETMADIGTDHGFLPVYLLREGISPKVIMCDISLPSLEKAKQAAGDLGYYSEEAFRVGDGLNVLEKGEVNAVVIAGMGGALIRDILAFDIDKSKSFDKYIFQPRNNCGLLRHWLFTNGFDIVSNQLVREGKFICEVICAKPSKNAENAESSLALGNAFESGILQNKSTDFDCTPEYEFPSQFIIRQPKLGRAYAESKLEIEEKIKEGILKSRNINETELAKTEGKIKYLKKLLGR